jgi:hypothetical protein
MAAGDAVFQVFSGVSDVCFKCFYLGVSNIAMAYMHVANICFKCFSCFRRTFYVFHLDVAEVYLDVA